jgi:hypothetical protein
MFDAFARARKRHTGEQLDLRIGIARWRYLPTASETHFFEKLDLAAPASFLSEAALSQLAEASFSHFVMNDFSAAPASFFELACA